MATLRHGPNFCAVVSDTKRIIRANPGHFSALSILFLLPLSIAFILYPSLITAYDHHKSHIILTLVFALFVLLFSLSATASISYSAFHGFYNRPVSFTSSLKSILFSFFPLLLTVVAYDIILISIFVVLGILGVLLYEGLVILRINVDCGSNYLLGFVISIVILILVVTVYLQVECSLAYAVVVFESKLGFAALKRSAYLTKGMKWIALSIMLYYGVLPGVLAASLLVHFGGTNRGSTAILESVLCSFVVALTMLLYVVAYTVLYVYCMVLRGEMALEVTEESVIDYVRLPVDDGKD